MSISKPYFNRGILRLKYLYQDSCIGFVYSLWGEKQIERLSLELSERKADKGKGQALN